MAHIVNIVGLVFGCVGFFVFVVAGVVGGTR